MQATWYVPRVNHAAAELKDGLILIVGGSDGTSLLLIAEVFDPATGAEREYHRIYEEPANQGHGNDAPRRARADRGWQRRSAGSRHGGIVQSVAGQTFFDTGSMKAARTGHVAILLPNNNQVLIAGGTVAGQPTASAELYSDWTDGF